MATDMIIDLAPDVKALLARAVAALEAAHSPPAPSRCTTSAPPTVVRTARPQRPP